MSFVRRADPSTAYTENLYIHKFAAPNSNFAARRFASDTQLSRYGPEPYNAEYGNMGFTGAPSAAFQNSFCSQQTPVTPYHVTPDGRSLSVADTKSNPCANAEKDSPVLSNVSQQYSQSVSDSQSSEIEVEFDEDEIRLKLQELEHALLDDGDDILFEISQAGSINDEWADPMKNVLLPNSPKESASSISCAVNNSRVARTPKQLLFDCATALSEYNIDEAQAIITDLRQMVSIQGDPSQRIAAYLVEGLAARIVASGKGIYKALTCKDPPTLYQLSAMQILFEICPCFRLGFMAANYAILEACKSEERLHIIDFDINQGSQYITLIQFLKNNANKPRKLRITGVDDPETVQRPTGGLRVIGQRLEKLAEDCGLSFEFRAVGANIGDVTPAMLDCHPGETLIVNFAFQLHHLPDESVSIMNERDQLLRMVKGLQPKLVTLVEQDANTNTAPFLIRFREVYDYYSALFDSLDATLPRESPDRMNVERQCLAREIVNILACEGPDRVERYEVAGKWRTRMAMAGFTPCPFNSDAISEIRSLLKSYCDRYKFEEDHAGLHFGWGEKTIIVSSAWL
ncbi:scarecrow-like protein 1 [Phragmites australis]|uniref:scarecrow-like protein 1 n=1 Tax=Phragmites australis TaxID=29695 RepID=UPI002D78B225|nr:scarecrow-like protein 1 [Phragmites australis]XP_062227594.1 scarecrow-like protein 1 [Phragmites australis]